MRRRRVRPLLPPLASCKRHLYGEDRPGARPGADFDGGAQKIADALHNGKAQAKTSAALAGGIVELTEFLKDRFVLVRRNAYSRIPDLDAQHVAAGAAAE